MADPTPTRAEVEAARFAPYSDAPSGDGWMDYHPHGEWVRLADYEALRERAEAAERRAYDLAVAIMGGEDAPGYADSVPTQVLVDQQRKMAAEWVHAVPAAEARAREAAAWEAVETLTFIRDAITESITVNDSETHRIEIDGVWHTGPVVDWAHKVLIGLRDVSGHVVAKHGLTPTDATAALTAVKDAEWNAAIEAAAKACTTVIKDYDVMTPCGNKYEPIKVQRAAKGMVSLARQDIRALRRAAPTEGEA